MPNVLSNEDEILVETAEKQRVVYDSSHEKHKG